MDAVSLSRFLGEIETWTLSRFLGEILAIHDFHSQTLVDSLPALLQIVHGSTRRSLLIVELACLLACLNGSTIFSLETEDTGLIFLSAGLASVSFTETNC